MKSDIQIAQESKMLHIKEVAQKLDIKLSSQDKHNQLIKPLTHKKIENLPIRYEVENSLPENVKEFFNNDKKYIALCTTSKLIEKDMPIETAIDLINQISNRHLYLTFHYSKNSI